MFRSMSRAVLFLAATLFAALVAAAGSASAHGSLDFSDPADGATVKTAPAAITLVFGENVDPATTEVAVTGPNGAPANDSAPSIAGLTVSSRFVPGPDGTYTVSYKVISADGTPVTGLIHFTLATGGAPNTTVNPNATPSPNPNAAPTSSPNGTPTSSPTTSSAGWASYPPMNTASSGGGAGGRSWLWLIAAGAVAAAVATVIVFVRRRRARS